MSLPTAQALNIRRAPSASAGSVFTRRWVADLLLELSGYLPTQPLASMRAVEPACGSGAFLVPMVQRLLASCRMHSVDVREAVDALHATDLDPDAVAAARSAVTAVLEDHGMRAAEATHLASVWVRRGDFLLPGPEPDAYDFVIGNPPYVRLENVPSERMTAYRNRWETMAGRADVYVGFIEAGLRSLRQDGVLGYICADRWMRNQYGQRLRSFVEERFAVDATVVMHDVDAFEDRVAAYPAVVVLRRADPGQTLVADTKRGFGEDQAEALLAMARTRRGTRRTSTFTASWTRHAFRGQGSWPTGSPARISTLSELEDRLPSLEESAPGTRVGVGLATGSDAVFITTDPLLVEDDRLLPLASAKDTISGTFEWSKSLLVNVWDDEGSLVDLAAYERLRRYLERNEELLRQRHIARVRPHQWYRTIDRVRPGLAAAPKLLLPDLKSRVHPVLDEGGHYPHHNLFWITSTTWDLEVLGGLLLSDLSNAFVEMYSVRMASGCLRVSAQYLRRIRIPHASQVKPADRRTLADAFRARDRERANAVALRLTGLKALPQ